MTGLPVFFPLSSALILLRVSVPSSPGMRWSSSMTSYACLSAMAMASSPLSTESIKTPVFFRRFLTTRIFILVSSTRRILASGAWKDSVYFSFLSSSRLPILYSPIGSGFSIFCHTSNEKTEPSPYLLFTFRPLPIRSRSLVVMDMPSPVPSIVLFFTTSSLSKDSKSFCISLSLIPIPVSATST